MLRAAWHQVARTPGVYTRLGSRRVEDAVAAAAADEATMAVLSRLDTFEERSRFTTWAYKFGILNAAVELRRASWRHVEIDLVALGDRASTMTSRGAPRGGQ
jgi:RNA polymerase sigma-70 factor, ECF subfamily